MKKARPFRFVLLAVVAALLAFGFSASPATAEQTGTAPTAAVEQTSTNVENADPRARYIVKSVSCYYWGCSAIVDIVSGFVSFGVYCPGWGYYWTNWAPTPGQPYGEWRLTVDCGSYIPAPGWYSFNSKD